MLTVKEEWWKVVLVDASHVIHGIVYSTGRSSGRYNFSKLVLFVLAFVIYAAPTGMYRGRPQVRTPNKRVEAQFIVSSPRASARLCGGCSAESHDRAFFVLILLIFRGNLSLIFLLDGPCQVSTVVVFGT